MKRQTKNLAIRSGIALALTLAFWSPVNGQSPEPAEGKPMMGPGMMDHCREMKEQKQTLKADIKTQDALLTQQLSEMNRAPKDKKVGLMATALTQMVEQRIIMDARKAKMEESMMQHMMQHMQMGKGSMAGCPMMKGMDKSPPVAEEKK